MTIERSKLQFFLCQNLALALRLTDKGRALVLSDGHLVVGIAHQSDGCCYLLEIAHSVEAHIQRHHVRQVAHYFLRNRHYHIVIVPVARFGIFSLEAVFYLLRGNGLGIAGRYSAVKFDGGIEGRLGKCQIFAVFTQCSGIHLINSRGSHKAEVGILSSQHRSIYLCQNLDTVVRKGISRQQNHPFGIVGNAAHAVRTLLSEYPRLAWVHVVNGSIALQLVFVAVVLELVSDTCCGAAQRYY